MSRPLGFAPEAALEDLGLPLWGPVWRWCSCLGRRASGSTRHSGELAVRAQEIQCSRRVWPPVLASTLSVLAWRAPFLTERPGRSQSAGLQTWTLPRRPCMRRHKTFFVVAALPQWELSLKWRSCSACGDMGCLRRRSYGPIRVFFRASWSWRSEGLFGQCCSVALPVEALQGAPLPAVLLCCSACQTHRGAPLAGVLLCRWRPALKEAPGWGPSL